MPSLATRRSNRWLILAICCLSLFIVGIDSSALNLALPSIKEDLHASDNQLQWVIDIYNLGLAAFLMLFGWLGDRLGRKRVFMTGLVVFVTGSIACAFATAPAMLIASRAVQSIGGAMLNPIAMAIITNTFTDRGERAKAIGLWGASIGLATALGPLIGGTLVELFGWQSVFWINVPVVITAFILMGIFVPESKAHCARRFDPLGQILMIVALSSLAFGIIEGRLVGWTSTLVITCALIFICALVLIIIVESHIAQPLLNPVFFRSWPFSGAVACAILGFMCLSGFLFLNTLYLQTVRGFSPVEAGLLVLPLATAHAVCAPISGQLVARIGPRIPMMLAGLFEFSGAVVLYHVDSHTGLKTLLLAYMLLGIGQGLLNAPITNTAVSGMPSAQAGVASAVASTSRQIGNALGVAIFGTLAFGALPHSASLADASHSAWLLMAGIGLTLSLIGFIITTPHARRTVVLSEE